MRWSAAGGVNWPLWLKFLLCAGFDLWDFSLGRGLFGVSLATDVLSAAFLVFLWGPLGLLALWEMLDVTEQFDGFVPSNLIVALLASRQRRTKAPARRRTAEP